jgi:hypothetical protein
MPKIGLSRFIVITDSDEEAASVARRAYPIWHWSFNYLFQLRGGAPAHPRPPDFDGVTEAGLGIAGTPATVGAFLQSQLTESEATYLVGQFAFGDLSLVESLRSVELFTRHVMTTLSPNGQGGKQGRGRPGLSLSPCYTKKIATAGSGGFGSLTPGPPTSSCSSSHLSIELTLPHDSGYCPNEEAQ